MNEPGFTPRATAQGNAGLAPVAALYMAFDGLQPINEAHGQTAGNEVLRIIAARLAGMVVPDHTVSCHRQDEFACVLAGLSVLGSTRDGLSHLACQLFDAMSAPCDVGPLKFAVHPSIGIAMCPVDGTTAETSIHNADTAMQCAQRQKAGYVSIWVNGNVPVLSCCCSVAAHRCSPWQALRPALKYRQTGLSQMPPPSLARRHWLSGGRALKILF